MARPYHSFFSQDGMEVSHEHLLQRISPFP